jgi:hypothetical protein
MPADWTIVAGDTEPLFSDTLEYANGEPVNLEGATVRFVMRALTAEQPQALKGTVTLLEPAKGKLYYAPNASDSAEPGNYMANWHVTFAGGEQQTFPTTGYLWVQVQENLTAAGGAQIVGLPEVKDYLQITEPDHGLDVKLMRWIAAVRPLVESLTGPIIPQVYEEWHGGGHATIGLRHKPSYGFGTSPVFQLMSVGEYRGPILYNLSVVGDPTQGTVYSCSLEPELGVIVRRTSGGGTMPFWRDPEHGEQTVRVVYVAGQKQVPANVSMAVEETLRWWWNTTQATGGGGRVLADEETEGRPMVALPYHAEKMLAPTARPPVCA